jgi:hypothetical protein
MARGLGEFRRDPYPDKEASVKLRRLLGNKSNFTSGKSGAQDR